MASNSNIDKVPGRLLNECSFCHAKGLKPGILAAEFRQDIRTQKHFSAIANELKLNRRGQCGECASITGST